MQVAPKNKITTFEIADAPLGLKFNTLFKVYYSQVEANLNTLDFDRYFYALSLICKHKETTQQCLANCLQVDKATMVRVIDYLTQKDLVKREPHKEDRRAYVLKPTAKALKALPSIETAFSQLNKTAFKGFTAEEKKDFLALMSKMHTNLTTS